MTLALGPPGAAAAGASVAEVVRGVGLTPRLREALLEKEEATLRAMGGAFVPAIGAHVQSAGESKQVMAQYWCPVVVERDDGARQVLHADPIVIRKFRRGIAEELKQVQEKRRRMHRRIQDIRQSLPPTPAQEVAMRLQREIDQAEARVGEALVRPLPQAAKALHVLVEASPQMLQLELVCDRLAQELPEALRAADVQYVTLEALALRGAPRAVAAAAQGLPAALREPLQCSGAGFEAALASWLGALAMTRPALTAAGKTRRLSAKPGDGRGKSPGELRVASALRRLATAEALGMGSAAALLVVCSPPADAEAAVELLRRSDMVLQVAGVFGVAPEDAEASLQRLADAAAPSSGLHLYFGPRYWRRYAACQRKQLEALDINEDDGPSDEGAETGVREVVSSGVLEIRLIERIMRECFVEEQRCEEELVCAGRLLDRTLVAPEDVAASMRGCAAAPARPPDGGRSGAMAARTPRQGQESAEARRTR